MIVYRSAERRVETREMLAGIRRRFDDLVRSAPTAVEKIERLLIEFGEFEAAMADAAAGERIARKASVALGRAYCRALRGHGCAMESFGRALVDMESLTLPGQLRVAVPEGYAYYGLHPQSYVDAAEQFYRERRPPRAVAIGIRSIGTGLSGVVAGALEERGCCVTAYTVRPGGHPWSRVLNVSEALEGEWREHGDAAFVIVDEGPGISGSSFASVADALIRAGVDQDRISLVPSWDAPAEVLKNPRAREIWRSLRRYVGSYTPAWLDGMDDVSGGRWRALSYGGDERMYPAVQPQHEARKHLSHDGAMFKFAGLGAYGEEKMARQEALAWAGFSMPVNRLADGYLEYEFVPGRPLNAGDLSRDLMERMARYLEFRSQALAAAPKLPFESMAEMIAVNAREALGRELALGGLEEIRRIYDARPAMDIDGRMMPYEWIAAEGRMLKADAVDHCSGHFYPGPADVAWDLAGAAVEFGMDAADERYLIDRYTFVSGDRVPPALMKFCRTAYLAFRTGYCAMAAEATLGTPDHQRFGALSRAYTRAVGRC